MPTCLIAIVFVENHLKGRNASTNLNITARNNHAGITVIPLFSKMILVDRNLFSFQVNCSNLSIMIYEHRLRKLRGVR